MWNNGLIAFPSLGTHWLGLQFALLNSELDYWLNSHSLVYLYEAPGFNFSPVTIDCEHHCHLYGTINYINPICALGDNIQPLQKMASEQLRLFWVHVDPECALPNCHLRCYDGTLFQQMQRRVTLAHQQGLNNEMSTPTLEKDSWAGSLWGGNCRKGISATSIICGTNTEMTCLGSPWTGTFLPHESLWEAEECLFLSTNCSHGLGELPIEKEAHCFCPN